MALDLSAIAFRVDTTELDRAGKAIGDLVVNVGKLDKAARDAAQTEVVLAKAAKLNADANLQNAKAQDTRLKSTITADKADQQAAAAIERKTKATERASTAIKKNADMLQLQNDTYDFILEGFSKGDAKVLAMAKATGQLSDQLKQVLTDIRQFSKNTFDQTETGLDRMVKSAKEASSAQGFLNNGLNLTSKQAKELSNDLDRLNIRLQHQGKSYQEITKEQAIYKQRFVEEANAVNRATSALAAVDKQRKDVVSATNYLTQADQRMAAALNTSNSALDKAGTDSLVKYEMALRKSGMTQDLMTQKLATYKVQLAQVQEQEMKRREQHLTRAISPQLMDIGVSLYSGQNPMTVLIQQSGQLVDLFQLSGVEASKLGEAMRKSFYSMVPAIATVTKGLSSLFFGMFVDAGRSITNFIGNVTGLNKVLRETDDILYLIGGRATWFSKILATLGTIASVTFGAGILAIVAGLAALAVGLKQVITENNDLAKAFALSGASIGLSHTQMIGYVKTLADSGATTGQATEALLAMAKAGNFTSGEILLVSKSAVEMQKGFGIAIEDTVKQFVKLKEKPVEALLEIAKSSGMVGPEVIKMVQELERAGRSTEAASVAMKAYADVTKEQVAQMKTNYNGFALFMIDLGQKIKQFFSDTFKTLFLATDPNQQLEDQLVKLRDRIKEVSGNLQSLGSFGDPKLLNQLKEQERMLISQIGANVRLRGEEEKRKFINAENAKYEEAILKLRKGAEDAIDKETRKTETLSDFRKSFIEDKLKDAAKEKAVDIEKLRLNIDLMKLLQQQADIEYKRINKKDGKQAVKDLETEIDLRNKQLGLLGSFNNELAAIERRRKATGDEDQYQKSLNDLIKKQPIYIERQKEINAAHDLENKLLGKADMLGKDYYKTLEQIQKSQDSGLYSPEKAKKLRQAAFDQTELAKTRLKIEEESYKLVEKYRDENEKSLNSVTLENAKLDDRLALLGLTSEQQKYLRIEQERRNKLLAIDLKLQTQIQDVWQQWGEGKFGQDGATKAKAVIVDLEQAAAEERKTINREVAVQYAEDFDKEFRAIKSGITDSLVTALFEGGKEGSKKLRQVLVDTLRKKVTIVVDAVVNTLVGNVVGSLFGGSGGGAGGSAGGSILGTISNGFSALNGSIAGGFSNAFTSFASSSVGQSLGLSNSSAIMGNNPSAFVPPGGQLTSLGSGLGTAAGMLGSGLAGYGISSAISGGYTTGGNTVNAIAGIASAFLGPIAGVAGGLINRAFGRKLKDTGIQGTFGGQAGFEGEGYQFYKGGWLRSDKTKTSELDSGLQKMLSDSFKAMQVQAGTFATILGLSTDKIAGFTTSMKVSLHGLKEEEIQGKIQEALATANNELAQQVIGTWTNTSEEITRQVQNTWAEIEGGADAYRVVTETVESSTYVASEYAKEGEKAIDTLTRLAGSLSTVNSTFKNFGWSLYEVSLAGASASSKFVDLFGTMENFTQAASTYYENFYTDAERAANVTRDITEALAKFGLETPKTREGYRALVEQQQKLGESGTESVAVLLKLSGAFAGIVDVVNSTTTEVQALANAEEERMNAAREAANRLVEDQVKSFKSLQDELKKEAFKKTGGNAYGFNVAISEVQSSEKFVTALDSATTSLAELEKLNLGSEFEKYASELGKVIQGTRELFANTLAVSRLAQGDAQGAIAAKMGASQLNPANFSTAGAFNSAYAKEQAIAAKGLVDVANANALTTANVSSVIGQLNAFASSELILNEIKQGFIQGVREASNTTSTYVVRDAIQGLAGVFAGAEANRQFLNTSTGLPAIAAAYAAAADMQKVQMIDGARYMGEFSIAYAQSVSTLNANFNRGKITATELEGAIKSLETSFGNLKEYAVTPVDVAMSRIGASSSIATEGIKALNLYFGQLTARAADLAEQAKIAAEPIAIVTDVIGKMTSYTDVFSKSANAVIDGFKGMTGIVDAMSYAIYQMEAEGSILTAEQKSMMMADAVSSEKWAKQNLKEALTYGSQVRKALLIAQAGSIAGDTLTTSDASKVADKLQVDPAFAKLTAAGIRDASLLLDGLKQFDANSFEKVFVRISEALNQGALNEEQYAALFDESIKIYTDYDAKIKQVTDSFNDLRNAAKSLADQLLIDAGYTTLTGGQTLVESQRQYNELMYRALQGDVTAASQLGGATQSMLTIAKQQATTEQDYARVFGSTIGDLRTVESMPLPARIAEPIQVVGQTNEELIAEIKALREEIRAGNAQIASNTDKTVKSLQDFQVNGLPTTTLV